MRERGAEKPEVAGAALTCAGRYSITGSDRDSVDQSNCSVLDFVMWRLDYEALSCADGMCAYFSRSFLTLPTPRGGLVSMMFRHVRSGRYRVWAG